MGGNTISPLTGVLLILTPVKRVAVVSLVQGAVSFVSAPSCVEVTCRRLLTANENLEGFQFMTVRAVEERAIKLQFACWDGNYAFFVGIS